MKISNLPDWLQNTSTQFLKNTEMFPQSLLIYGQKGLGKTLLAEYLATSLLCDSTRAEGKPCGQCHQCRLFQSGNHPDFHAVLTEKQTAEDDSRLSECGLRYLSDNQRKPGKKTHSGAILIDQVRLMSANAVATPQIANKSVVLISPADSLNLNAANSLLKILEEPVSSTYFLLVAHRVSTLPATIRSRCQHLAVSLPPGEISRSWLMSHTACEKKEADIALNQAAGAPLSAASLIRNKFITSRSEWLKHLDDLTHDHVKLSSVATHWKKTGAEISLLWLYGWVRDLIHQKINSDTNNAPFLFNADCVPRLRTQSKRLNLKQLLMYLGIVERRYTLIRRSNTDELLLLEEVLSSWNGLFSNIQ